MTNGRVQRGRFTEKVVAAAFQDHGFYGAEPTHASEQGTDVSGVPGWDVEVKATSKGDLLAALRQQEKRKPEGTNGVVVWRPNGYGPEKAGQWVAALRFDTFLRLLQDLEFPEAEALPAEDVRELPDGEQVRQAVNTLNDWLNAHN